MFQESHGIIIFDHEEEEPEMNNVMFALQTDWGFFGGVHLLQRDIAR